MSMHKRRVFNIYNRKNGWKRVSYSEWTTWVKSGKRGSIVQIAGAFLPAGIRNFFQICTGPSNRKNRLPDEWESRVWDSELIDLVNPLYCRGSIEAIEAMHAKALSNARQFLRNYIERPIPYWESIVDGADLRYLAKTPDFAVDYFEEDRDEREEDL